MDALTTFQEACRQHSPSLAVVLGSGMGAVVERWGRLHSVSFGAVPGLTATGVHGHRGQVSLVELAGKSVLVFEGRLHYYEGHSWERVVRPTQLAYELGARSILHTNAAGGIRDDLVPGTLMAITDHLELTRPFWWRHPRREPTPYSPQLRETLQAAARLTGIRLAEGVYASLTGPSYETKAEIRALRSWGADAVGMSTAREVAAGCDLGMECAAVSCITNKACGLSEDPLSHQEVISVARAQESQLARLVEHVLKG